MCNYDTTWHKLYPRVSEAHIFYATNGAPLGYRLLQTGCGLKTTNGFAMS